MGHYDLDRSGPSKHEVQQRRRAYETKKNAQAREEITNEQIREFLFELNECRDADGLTCGGSTYCNAERHAQDVLFGDDAFDAAQTLVEQGAAENEYEAIGTNRVTKQLVAICQDAQLITMGGAGHQLTDTGHQVMLGDEFDRPSLSWDESKAKAWHKHD